MIILDMDMPKSCADCRINTDGNGRCGLINSSCMYFAGHNTKPVYCPIKALEQEPILDKIREIVDEWQSDTWTDNLSYECMAKITELVEPQKSEEV